MSGKHAGILKSNKPNRKKHVIKRKWRKVVVQKDDIQDFEEGGLISIEELTDYNIEGGEVLEPNISAVEPSKKKRKQEDKNDSTTLKASKEENEPESTEVVEVVEVVSKKKKQKKRKKKPRKTNKKKNESDSAELINDTQENIPEELSLDDDALSDKVISEKTYKMVCDMSEWNGLGIPEPILASLAEKGFTKPTPIQAATLPVAISHRQDIIGAAETGSGKTLAFALPILTHILDLKGRRATETGETNHSDAEDKPLYALILTPTRELALQIHKHIEEVTKNVPVRCVAIVGGLSEQKQERILSKSPEIVIGTPGRLLDMIREGKPHLTKLGKAKFLVIDEVDRMLQLGHFKEVSEILEHLSPSTKRQTFLFSATLTVPQFHKKWSANKGKKADKESVQLLVDKVTVNAKAKIIDLSSQHIAAEQIKQKRIICTDEEKDLYLIYVILCNVGRTLIFVNSINCTRKICSFLAILGKNPLQLHAGKQQRQRLKALDRFVSSDDSVLVATDVAARGLDIPNVDLVIHYHLPKDPKIYIHRSGRTARATKGGVSVILEGPQDFREYKKIYDVMKLNSDLPPMDVDPSLLPDLKKRVLLAKKIEREEHQDRKKTSEKNWFKKAAESLEIEVPDFDAVESDEENHKRKKSNNVKALKRELSQLLKLPLVPRGFSGNFITRTGSLKTMGI